MPPGAEPLQVVAEWRRRFPEYIDALRAARKEAASAGKSRGQDPSDKPLARTRPPTPELATTGPLPTAAPDLSLSYLALHSDGKIADRLHGDNADRINRYAPGTELEGRYRLEKELGRGGMGVVFLGRDLRLDRPVAIKVMLPSTRAQTTAEQEQLETMFAQEARLGANLNHPAIATVFDYGFHESLPYTVLEYVPGEQLRARVGKGRQWPLADVLLLLAPVAQALDFAHSRRIVHRDLKPENIQVTPQGQFKILDLGIAKEFDRQRDWSFQGTPAYASPEQATGQPCDGRADQYAVALIVYEMLTGRRPFQSTSAVALLDMHRCQEPPWPEPMRPDVSGTIRAALMRALAKDPNRRYSSCEEFAVAMGCQFLSAPAPLPEDLLDAWVHYFEKDQYQRRIDRLEGAARPWYQKASRVLTKRISLVDAVGASGLRALLGLSPEALWVSEGFEFVRVPIPAIVKVGLQSSRFMQVEFVGSSGSQVKRIQFGDVLSCKRFHDKLAALIGGRKRDVPAFAEEKYHELKAGALRDMIRKTIFAAAVENPRYAVTGVRSRSPGDEADIEPAGVAPPVLMRQRPLVRYQMLGSLEAQAKTRGDAKALLRLRGAMVEADAVIDVREDRLSMSRLRRLTGTAVRAVDQGEKWELRTRWLGEQSGRIAALAFALSGWLLFGLAFSWWKSITFFQWLAVSLEFRKQPDGLLYPTAELWFLETIFAFCPVLVAAVLLMRRRPQWALPALLFLSAGAQVLSGVADCGQNFAHYAIGNRYSPWPLWNLVTDRSTGDIRASGRAYVRPRMVGLAPEPPIPESRARTGTGTARPPRQVHRGIWCSPGIPRGCAERAPMG